MTAFKPGRWVLDSAQAGLSSLHYDASHPAPNTADLGPEDVIVEMRAASLNYRDLAIARGNPQSALPLPATPDIIPGSDGSGIIVAVGSEVPVLKPGTKVLSHMVPFIAAGQLPCLDDISSGLGQRTHGTLCRTGLFHYSALVEIPESLTFEEAATLTCSGLTAWNALMGSRGREVKDGDWVLVQGTGVVSIAALQIALAAGANVIATTSSAIKAERLRSLGAKHVLNYRTQPNWGSEAKKLTPESRGVDHVVDVGGQTTLAESINAVRVDGLITVAGFIAGTGDTPGPEAISALWRLYVMRGILLGTREMMRDMVAWFAKTGLRPAVDDVVFSLEDAKKAYERLERQEHFSKVIIKLE